MNGAATEEISSVSKIPVYRPGLILATVSLELWTTRIAWTLAGNQFDRLAVCEHVVGLKSTHCFLLAGYHTSPGWAVWHQRWQTHCCFFVDVNGFLIFSTYSAPPKSFNLRGIVPPNFPLADHLRIAYLYWACTKLFHSMQKERTCRQYLSWYMLDGDGVFQYHNSTWVSQVPSIKFTHDSSFLRVGDQAVLETWCPCTQQLMTNSIVSTCTCSY